MLQMGTGIRCQICYMTFTDQSTINAHYEAIHDDSSRGAYACDICDKRFTTKHWLRHHMTTAHGVGEARRFTCDVCSREFNRKSNLTTHIKRVHKVWKRWLVVRERSLRDTLQKKNNWRCTCISLLSVKLSCFCTSPYYRRVFLWDCWNVCKCLYVQTYSIKVLTLAPLTYFRNKCTSVHINISILPVYIMTSSWVGHELRVHF